MHLESLKISPDVNEINEGKNDIDQLKSERIIQRISRAFAAQQQQSELISNHVTACPYPVMICGDMNNSAYSYVYRIIRGNLADSFEAAGEHFGATYNFKYYPARIDYIFVDKSIKIKGFENFSNINFSDHSPIITRLLIEQ